jgi:uncharacterized coiled-coil protein SlyX
MDTLQKQIDTLNSKIDALHQIIDQLSGHLAQVLTQVQNSPSQSNPMISGGTDIGRYSYQAYRASDPSMEHKDVLSDHTSVDSMSQGNNKTLSPEIQIQRLTAQLTAAYNRIAALEEQLLSQRVHS